MKYSGGCACGALRFDSIADPVDGGYCHCRLCQKTNGAPVLAWASFPIAAFRYTQGVPARFASSPTGLREFCAACGTPLAFRMAVNPATVNVYVGALDDPNACPPRQHVWCDSAISWFTVEDRLPRYAQAAPPAKPA